MSSREVNGRWALSRVVSNLADAMDENPDAYEPDDYAALDAAGQIVFRIEDDEGFMVDDTCTYKQRWDGRKGKEDEETK